MIQFYESFNRLTCCLNLHAWRIQSCLVFHVSFFQLKGIQRSKGMNSFIFFFVSSFFNKICNKFMNQKNLKQTRNKIGPLHEHLNILDAYTMPSVESIANISADVNLKQTKLLMKPEHLRI